MKSLLTLTMVALLGGVAQAEDAFDPTGWKYLGGMAAHGEEQKLRVRPHAYTGSISEIAIVAESGKAKVTKIVLMHEGTFTQTLEPDEVVATNKGQLVFDVEAALVPIDLIEVTVTGVAEDSNTRLLVFGRDPTATPREKVDWDHTGWIELDKSALYSRVRLDSGEKTELAMIAIVPEAEVDLSNVEIRIDGAAALRDAQVTPLAPGEPYLVDLSNEPKPVVVAGVNLHGVIAGAITTQLTLYGLPTTAKDRPLGRILRRPSKEDAAQAAADATKYEDLGWTLLGEDDVDLVDDEVVVPKKQKGTWSQVKVVVVGDAVKLRTLDLHLGGKKSKVQTEALEQTYGDDDDSVVIDIPGKRRAIKKVRLQYKKHKLDASTRVQIYAR